MKKAKSREMLDSLNRHKLAHIKRVLKDRLSYIMEPSISRRGYDPVDEFIKRKDEIDYLTGVIEKIRQEIKDNEK